MLNIIICDDEKALRRDLKQILETELGLMGISYRIVEYSSGEEVLSEYRQIHGQKILYLDIKLDNMNGMETARQIRQWDPSSVIIFVTVYPEFVFQAGSRLHPEALRAGEDNGLLSQRSFDAGHDEGVVFFSGKPQRKSADIF